MIQGKDFNYWPCYTEDTPLVLRETLGRFETNPAPRTYKGVNTEGDIVYFAAVPALGQVAVCEERRQLVDWVELSGFGMDRVVKDYFGKLFVRSPW